MQSSQVNRPSSVERGPLRRSRDLAAAILAALLVALTVAGPAAAVIAPTTQLDISTPFPGISVAPGERASFDLTITSNGPVRADLTIAGIPEGWTAQITGGGHVISAVEANEETPAQARLDVTVPAEAAPNSYRMTVTAESGNLRDDLEIDVVVSATAGGEVTLTTDFPSLRGPASTNFTFNLTLANDTAQDLTFGVNAQGPAGWVVTARPTSQSQASTFQVNAGSSTGITVSAEPPPNVAVDTYPIAVTATSGERQVGGELSVEITGDFEIELTTPDGRLNANGPAGGTVNRTLLIRNPGTGPLTDVTMGQTLPTDWNVTYEPVGPYAQIAPGESIEVTAVMTPAANAIAGDYVATFRATAGGSSTTDSTDIRVTIETPLNWLVVGIGIIVLVLLGLGIRVPAVRPPMSEFPPVDASAKPAPTPAPTPTPTRASGPLPAKKAVRRKRVLHRDEPIPPRPDPIDPDVVIRIRGLTKRYGTRTAVDALNLDIRRGEIFGLLGPNGAGKTTTVLMLLGLTEPSAGDVTVAGFDPRRESLKVKRRVGYLPDSVGFYGGLTGRENLRYTARLNGIPRREAEERISEVLEQVGLGDRADDRADTYSRGMRQRLGIADALVKDPEVLILDEPTTAIDPMGVVEMLALIRGLARDRGIAILLASHLLDQVQSVCHRVGIFDRGRIIGLGAVDELAVTFGEPPDRLDVVLDPETAPDAEVVAARLADVPGVLAVALLEEGSARAGWRLAVDPVRPETDVVRAVCRRGAHGRLADRAARPRAPIARTDLSAGGRAGGGGSMSVTAAPTQTPAPAATSRPRMSAPPRAGWTVVAGKEFGDHLRSARFYVLLGLLGLVAVGTSYVAAEAIREVAGAASDVKSIFLKPFLFGRDPIPPFVALIGFLVPILGIAFGFDAISGERSEGTLPRLVSQPIYRDDVINGKFAAGLAIIGLILVAVTALVAGVVMVRLGIPPSAEDVVRLVAWLAVSIVYVGFWLAFATLCSVAFRRAATALLVAIGLWLLATLFAALLASIAAGVLAPVGAEQAPAEVLANAQMQDQLVAPLAPDAVLGGDLGDPRSVGSDDQHAPARGSARSRDRVAALARPEPAAGLDPGGRDRRVDRGLVRDRLHHVHAPGGPRVAAG